MAITNPFTITYGSRSLGADSDIYQIHGPYVLDKSFENFRMVFDVVVVADSYANLQTYSNNIETDFRLRDQGLTIDIDGSPWTYTSGTTILNSKASLSKTGDSETDRGFSRAYTLVIEGELPADDNNGLRDLEVNVDFDASRQKTVTFRGVYTAADAVLAAAKYLADFDAEATTILTAIDSGATFELEIENYNRDRNDHICNFSRQYVELLANQTQANLDDTDIKDHRMVFTDLSAHPGDSQEGMYRLRRVVGSYDCAIDIDQTTDLQTVFDSKVKTHVKELFRTEFTPQVFAIEDRRVSYDETSKRMSVAIQFVYQKSQGGEVVEVSQSLAYRESRDPDYTPVHDGDEFSAFVDPGWAILERVASRTVIVIGDETPKRRIGVRAKDGPAGEIIGIEAGPGVVNDGWTIIQNTSQVTDQWVGDPSETQIKLTVLTETVVERYNSAPGGGGGGTKTQGPTTGRKYTDFRVKGNPTTGPGPS